MKPIPISAAKKIAHDYGYDQIVIIGRKVGSGEHCTTYGVDRENCDAAADIGRFLKSKVMQWVDADAPLLLSQRDRLLAAAKDVLDYDHSFKLFRKALIALSELVAMSAFDEDPREDQDEEMRRQFAKLLSQRDRLLAIMQYMLSFCADGFFVDARALIAEIEKENGK